MTKIYFLITLLSCSLLSCSQEIATNSGKDYDYQYCVDQKELDRWQRILIEDGDKDEIQTIHALWIGLCEKVKRQDITSDRANIIFELMRNVVVERAYFHNEEIKKPDA